MQSAILHPDVISRSIENELQLGLILCPFARQYLPPDPHISCFGVIPKGHTPGKWHLITDWSFPKGRSVNDGINRIFCNVSYSSVDMAASIATSMRKRALLPKVDVESAYRLIPIHPLACKTGTSRLSVMKENLRGPDGTICPTLSANGV